MFLYLDQLTSNENYEWILHNTFSQNKLKTINIVIYPIIIIIPKYFIVGEIATV